jgi:hypothetical protein
MATTEETAMKLTTLALAAVFALTSTFAFAHSHHRHHHYWMHGGSGGPNGTAGGPTSLSGTGSSQFGGSTPGAAETGVVIVRPDLTIRYSRDVSD